jgi:hypothetical protein
MNLIVTSEEISPSTLYHETLIVITLRIVVTPMTGPFCSFVCVAITTC